MRDDDQAAVERFNAIEGGTAVDPLEQSVVGATLSAVEAARGSGFVTAMDEGTVTVLLRMAERMDDPDFPYIEGRFDNVTEGLYAKLSNELGLTAAGRMRMPEKKEAKGGKLSVLRDEAARRRA